MNVYTTDSYHSVNELFFKTISDKIKLFCERGLLVNYILFSFHTTSLYICTATIKKNKKINRNNTNESLILQ